MSNCLRSCVYNPIMEGAAGWPRVTALPPAPNGEMPHFAGNAQRAARLKHLVHACAGRLVHRPGEPGPAFSRARRMVAVLASFLVSGLVHEGLYW